METDALEIKPDDVFTHIESGNLCVVLVVGKMKDEHGTWYPSVTYRNPAGKNPETAFTRSREAFKEKFARGAKE